MKNPINILNILVFSFVVSLLSTPVQAENVFSGWTKSLSSLVSKKRSVEPNPYLEDVRHLQIAQWEHTDWYAEDWSYQKDSMSLVKGFYTGDIIRGQYLDNNQIPVLVVGPNFYRLSGLDKRRVTQAVSLAYGITDSKENGSFMLRDWYTKSNIGTYDHHGLRLH